MKTILIPNKITYKTTCNHCKCVFTFNPSDVDVGMGTGLPFVSCPSCGRLVYRGLFRWKKVKY